MSTAGYNLFATDETIPDQVSEIHYYWIDNGESMAHVALDIYGQSVDVSLPLTAFTAVPA